MADRRFGLRVPKRMGERARQLAVDMKVFDSHRRIWSDEQAVYLPLLEKEAGDLSSLLDLEGASTGLWDFQEDRRRLKPEDLLGRHPSFELVGDIALVDDPQPEEVAHVLMRLYRNIRTVLAPISDVEGEYRTRHFLHLAGEDRTFTVHRENGLLFKVDLEKAYFSPRLGTERLRVVDTVRPGENVLDMFAGVGPFALLCACRGALVVAMDSNPWAVKFLKENVTLNRLDSRVLIRQGDSMELACEYEGWADHVVMNLPHSAKQFLDPAIKATVEGGVLHYYAFAPEDALFDDLKFIEGQALSLGRVVEPVYKGIVRSYSPHRMNVVMDLRLDQSP